MSIAMLPLTSRDPDMSRSLASIVSRQRVMWRLGLSVTCFALLVTLAACSDGSPTAPDAVDPSLPQPGTLLVQVSGAHVSDAAFQLEITGVRSADELTAALPGLQFHARQRGEVWRVAVFGTSPTGELLRVRVPDLRDVGRYTTRVIDVAREDGVLRDSVELAAYRGIVRLAP
jgi:hypothetical protein